MAHVLPLPNTGYAPNNKAIAAHLRQQAEWLDADDAAGVRNVILVIEYVDGDLRRQTMGEKCDLARAIGLLTLAASRAGTRD
jgi:hypothetical protein